MESLIKWRAVLAEHDRLARGLISRCQLGEVYQVLLTEVALSQFGQGMTCQ